MLIMLIIVVQQVLVYIQKNRLEMNRPTPVCCGIGCGLLDGFCKAGTWGLGCGLIFDACCMKMCPASGYVDHVHTMYFDDFTLWQNSCCHYEYIPQRQGCCGKCCYKNTNGMCCTIDKVNLSCCPKMCLCLKCCWFKDGFVTPFIDGIAGESWKWTVKRRSIVALLFESFVCLCRNTNPLLYLVRSNCCYRSIEWKNQLLQNKT